MHRSVLAGLALAAISTPVLAQSAPSIADDTTTTSLTLTTGVDYSSGNYGLADKTKIAVVPIVARLVADDFAFTASIPYIHLDTPGGVVIGPDGKPLPGVPSSGGTTNGFGDVNVGAKYTVPSALIGGADLTLGGRVKLPTASTSKGLSTGKTDFNATAELGYTFGTVSPFVEVGYRWLGDPAGVNLRNGPTLSAGSSFSFGRTVLIASYDYARSATASTNDNSDLFGGLAVPVGKRLTLTGYGTKGLSDGSPDYGVGLLLSAKLF
jgi:hypothetical protein